MSASQLILFYAILFPSLCCCVQNLFGQVFPLPAEAVIRQVIGGQNLSCEADYTAEYNGIQTPIVFRVLYLNSENASRLDVDLANGSAFTQEVARNLAPSKADKPTYIFLYSSKQCFITWPALKAYCDQFIPDAQSMFFNKNITALKEAISDEDINGVACIKDHIVFNLAGGLRQEAFVWLTKDGHPLPKKLEMVTEDFLNVQQKMTIVFNNWVAWGGDSNAFLIPQDYTRIRDIHDMLPKHFQSVTAGNNVDGVEGSSSGPVNYFKNFLASPPDIISALTFIRVDTRTNQTRIVTGRLQSNAMFYRELNSTNEIDETNQDPNKLIISQFNQHSSVLRNHILFHGGDPILKLKMGKTPDDMSFYENIAQHKLSEPLKMGILFAVLKTFKWNGNNFTADDEDGGKLTGHLTVNKQGWPERVVYTRDSNGRTYQVDYSYSENCPSNCIPSEMSLSFAMPDSYGDYLRLKPYKEYFILDYKTSSIPLPEASFSLEQYKPNVQQRGVVVYSNYVAYVNINGTISPANKTMGQFSATNIPIDNVRRVVLVLMLLPTIIFVTVLVIKKRKQQKQK